MADAEPVQNPIEFIEGATNILLIAPHGHEKDDENTGALLGKEDAVYELSDEVENCVILTGKISGKNTSDKIRELGRKNGLLIFPSECPSTNI